MDSDYGAVWTHYQPGYIPGEYAPYHRTVVTDRWGNRVSINTWQKQGPPTLVQPELVRINKGLTFQRMFTDDPCPNGWKSVQDGYCVREELKYEPVFYTEKAFIPKRQFWNGYATAQGGGPLAQGASRVQGPRRISDQFDMRSVDPFTGEYEVFYQSSNWGNQRRYAKPIKNDRDQYDTSWGLASHGNYVVNATSDSYL